MNEFYQEVNEKKQAARSARYKKNGCRSKKCSLPSDHMTQKQWKERNGRVMTYQLNVPMRWSEFKKLPSNIQKMYIERLAMKYSIGTKELAEMFGVSTVTVHTLCKRPEIGISFSRKRKMTPEQRENFAEFMGIVRDKEEDSECDQNATDPIAEERVDATGMTVIGLDPVQIGEHECLEREMTMNSVRYCFSGNIDYDSLITYLSVLVPEGSVVNLEVNCEIIPSPSVL